VTTGLKGKKCKNPNDLNQLRKEGGQMRTEKVDRVRNVWIVPARRFVFISLFVMAAFLTGCADVTVYVHRHLYKPVLPESVVGFYKGKQIDLNSFENLDEKTRKWIYYSPDKKVAYQAAVPLEYFVMDCFRDALWLAGVSVLKESPDVNIPDMTLIIDHWTDAEFKFTVSIMKNNALKFRNQYAVTMPSSENADSAKLEKNAYEMMNKAVLAVLSDLKLQALFK
jgi:hypothetical protein